MPRHSNSPFSRLPFVITLLLSLTLALSSAPSALADTVSGEVFLRGNFTEVGIHPAGSFGTSVAAPAGFHPIGRTQLGFVADQGRDGWSVGTPPQSGDYFLPGSPEEGWSVEWTVGGAERTFGNYGRMSVFQVPQTSLTETSAGSTRSAVWVGTATSGSEQLRVTQNVHFDVDDLFFIMSMTLTNVGSVMLDSVEYMRNVDPDQEQDLGSGFSTRNYVLYQPERTGVPGRPDLAARPAGNTTDALVMAEGLGFSIPLGLGTVDSRAAVSNEGFSNRDPDAILNTPIQPTQASPNVADEAIVLAFDLGSLAPGQSVSFDYVYILDAADLEDALGALAAVTIIQPTGTISGSSVLFQATTDDVPNTTRMDFFVGGVLVGSDVTPDGSGVFDTVFSSLPYPDGPLTIVARATFADASTAERTATVTVSNSGPPIAFASPACSQLAQGTGIPISITILDPGQPPTRVSFFRQTASTGTLFLGEDTAAPFTSSVDVDDVPAGETILLIASAVDAAARTTTIQLSCTPEQIAGGGALPGTGFPPGRVTLLPQGGEAASPNSLPGELELEIPALNLRETIVGIPLGSEGWDVSWLGGQIGYLQSSAFPTRPGNSVLTGHVYLANGLPGPFERLRDLQWGDQVLVYAWGQRYVFEVRQVATVGPSDRSAFRHEEFPWLTLVTCQDFDEARGTYRHRLLVRAVLMDVIEGD